MQISLAFHIIGIVLWVGGLMIGTRLMKAVLVDPEAGATLSVTQRSMLQRVFKGYILPGFILALGSGLYQIYTMGLAHYMRQGWFHGKLTLVLLLVIVTFLTGDTAARIARGEAINAKKLSAFHGIAGLCLVVIVFLTLLGRVYA